MEAVKKNLTQFIDNIIKKDYKSAHNDITTVINKKIKQQMINNNTTIF